MPDFILWFAIGVSALISILLWWIIGSYVLKKDKLKGYALILIILSSYILIPNYFLKTDIEIALTFLSNILLLISVALFVYSFIYNRKKRQYV
ncbi:hypothetical protein [Sutcliffiella halmapala]|uniref:hypothetical protein n=1 Tax=Sutcliffiella halmapala TaxID=79882 RepID=UPI000995A6B2|nr:hypothetical protein [Sutcliffiella halmapala]